MNRTARPPDVDAPLRAESLQVVRDGQVLLHDVPIAFPRRRITALVGPSGVGRSTLLRCLNRLEEPVAGRVLLEGQDVWTLDPRQPRRRVGMVFQAPVMFPGDVAANLSYGGPTADAVDAPSWLSSRWSRMRCGLSAPSADGDLQQVEERGRPESVAEGDEVGEVTGAPRRGQREARTMSATGDCRKARWKLRRAAADPVSSRTPRRSIAASEPRPRYTW